MFMFLIGSANWGILYNFQLLQLSACCANQFGMGIHSHGVLKYLLSKCFDLLAWNKWNFGDLVGYWTISTLKWNSFRKQ